MGMVLASHDVGKNIVLLGPRRCLLQVDIRIGGHFPSATKLAPLAVAFIGWTITKRACSGCYLSPLWSLPDSWARNAGLLLPQPGRMTKIPSSPGGTVAGPSPELAAVSAAAVEAVVASSIVDPSSPKLGLCVF